MRAFQHSYTDRNGKTQKTALWYLDARIEGRRYRIPGLTDKKQTEAIGRNIEHLISHKASREPLPPELSKWVDGLSSKLRRSLHQIGLVESSRGAGMEPLARHLVGEVDDEGNVVFVGFKQALLAQGNTPDYVATVIARAKRIIVDCDFVYWADLSASRTMAYLNGLRADKVNAKGETVRGISAQTFNFYLAALKYFCRWMVKDGRASESPIAHLDGLNVRVDRRHDRRSLSIDELRRLLETTIAAPTRHGMTGPERAMLYRVAVETGLRRGELKSLTKASFHLDGEHPFVRVAAASSKRRRVDEIPIRPDTAAELRTLLASTAPEAPAFNMPQGRRNVTVMFHADRNAAGIPYEVDGLYADFHALRHTTGSLLAAAGVHPKVAQSILRHSTIDLTMSRYTHVFHGQESDAVADLPDLGQPSEEAKAETDGKSTPTS